MIMSPHHLPGHPRILLVKLSSFGDVLHALPTLEALREAYPKAHITWLVEAAYAPLLSGHPALDEVWIAPRLRPGEFFSGSNPAALRRLVRQLRTQPFDLVVDVQGLLKSAVWVALAKSPRKVGYDKTRELSYLPLTERVKPFDPEAHAVGRYLNLAHYLGAPPTPPRFRLGLDAAADISALIPRRNRGAPGGAPSRGPLGLQTLAPAILGPSGGVVPRPGVSSGRHRQPRRPRVGRGHYGPMPGAAPQSDGPHLPGPVGRHPTKNPVGRHHRHRSHAPGSKPGNAGRGALRPYRALAHRAFRRGPPSGPPGVAVQSLLQASLPRPPVPQRTLSGNGPGRVRENLV